MIMIITEISRGDVKDCLDIYNYYIKNTLVSLEECELEFDAFEKRVRRITEKYPFLVAKNDSGKLLGYAYLDSFNERSAYRISADLSVYLDREQTHSGIGKKLLCAIEEEAKKRGIENIISIITSENLPSVGFHVKNGFVHEGTVNNAAVKFGRYVSVSYYRKNLKKAGTGRYDHDALSIRPACEADIPALDRLLYQVQKVHSDLRPDLFRAGGRKYNDEQIRDILSDSEKPVFVAELVGSVVGYAFCIRQQHLGSNSLTDVPSLYVDDLCVDESMRGAHIGSALYDFLLGYAKDKGYYSLTLNVWADNLGALGFYEREGLRAQKIGMEKIIDR